MKNKLSLLPVLLLTSILGFFGCKEKNSLSDASYNCVNGLAKDTYPCENFDLYAHVEAQELGGSFLNDIWGWTDPLTNKEYALVGLTDGVSFVDISEPNNPIVVGKLHEHVSGETSKVVFEEDFTACTFGIGTTDTYKKITRGTTWRDFKVYNNHLFVVRDGRADGNFTHGLQVFDLTRIRDFEGTFLNFEEDAHYDQLNNAHNIAINEKTGFAYAVGVTLAEQCGSSNETGIHIIDIRNPLQPVFAGCYFDENTDLTSSPNIGTGYIHDTQCVDYEGNDTEHLNKEICFSSAEGAVVITDVTDKENPLTIGFSGLSGMQYSHQGWLTEDHSYFLMNDELDESNLGRETRTYIWDVRDLDNPVFVDYYTHTTTSIDHNLYIKNNIVYQTNYTSGLRAFRIGNLSNAELIPQGFFDTQPGIETSDTRSGAYTGTWSNYPFFESGIVIVSDIEDGLFILKPDF